MRDIPTWEIKQGDALEVLSTMPDNSVHCVVTSPPYFNLRDYGVHGQIGLEPTPAAFIDAMVRVFREVRRVLRPDGTCWVNLGDSYSASGGMGHSGVNAKVGNTKRELQGRADTRGLGIPNKNLMMMPARVAIALQDDGWYLRSDIIWCKRAPMPESVTDRPTTAHEHIFLLTKRASYFYDAEAIREASLPASIKRMQTGWAGNEERDYAGGKQNHLSSYMGSERAQEQAAAGRNAWSYWLLSPEPTPEAHFATFPSEIPRRAILAGTSAHGCCAECGAPYRRVVERELAPVDVFANSADVEDDLVRRGFPTNGRPSGSGQKYQNWLNEHPAQTTGWQATCKHDAPVVPCVVLDPFSGSGTTVKVALRLGRRGIGIELSPEYVAMSERLIRNDAPLFNMAEATA